MRKLVAILFVLTVVMMGVTGALSVIPHAHGDDLDHSKHASCPVYQAGLHNHASVGNVFVTAVFFSFLFYLFVFRPVVGRNESFYFHLLRAPPASV